MQSENKAPMSGSDLAEKVIRDILHHVLSVAQTAAEQGSVRAFYVPEIAFHRADLASAELVERIIEVLEDPIIITIYGLWAASASSKFAFGTKDSAPDDCIVFFPEQDTVSFKALEESTR